MKIRGKENQERERERGKISIKNGKHKIGVNSEEEGEGEEKWFGRTVNLYAHTLSKGDKKRTAN